MTGNSWDYTELRTFADRLVAIPKEFQAGARAVLRSAGTEVLDQAKQNASWSTRIPQSLSLRVTLAGSKPGLAVRASLKIAPDARVYEGILEKVFRHPVFGDENTWVAQNARPYLLPAILAGQAKVADATQTLLDSIYARTMGV